MVATRPVRQVSPADAGEYDDRAGQTVKADVPTNMEATRPARRTSLADEYDYPTEKTVRIDMAEAMEVTRPIKRISLENAKPEEQLVGHLAWTPGIRVY